ncbi:MAG: TonB-dependent receptor, partial [Caulobacter sp.]
LEYLLGLYLYRQDGQTHREGFAGTAGPALGLASGARLPSAGEVTTKNVAAFGNTTYALTDRLKLGVGFRWSWEKKSVDYQIDGRAMAPLGIATGTFVDDHIDKDFSPTFTLNYAWTPRVTGYLRYAQGYKSGGYNLDFVSPTIFPNALEFEKETARSYEAGLKGDAFDRKLTFAFALFQTDFEDFQVDQFRDLGGGKVAIVIGNAAKARSKGAELEGSWRPTANLSFTGGLGVLDTTFVSFPGGGAQGRDVSGNRLPGASKVQGNLAADYLIPVGDWQVALHADYSHRGAYYSSVDNVEARPLRGGGSVVWGKVKSQDLVNARVALSDPDRGWELALWARNLFDRDYIAGYGSDFFGTSKQYYNPPRTWGVELGWSF